MHGPKPGQQVTAGLGFCPDSISFSGIQEPNSRIFLPLENTIIIQGMFILFHFNYSSSYSLHTANAPKKGGRREKSQPHTLPTPPHPPKFP